MNRKHAAHTYTYVSTLIKRANYAQADSILKRSLFTRNEHVKQIIKDV